MSPGRTLRVATRRSALAMAQSSAVGQQLAARTGRRLELVQVTTTGDLDRSPLAAIGGTGVFVTAVRQALVEGRADVAVHSLKDLPTTPDARLELAAVPVRHDPRDGLVTRDGATLALLPGRARVGTGSPRRRAQILAARPDVDVIDIRGNVDSRLARVLGGSDGAALPDLDAVVLAVAGLARLGRTEVISEHLDPEVVLPAPGQGALALEVPAGSELAPDVRALDDPGTRAAVTAERSVLSALAAGCSAPVGALGTLDPGTSDTLRVRAVLSSPRGVLLRRSATGPATGAVELGHRLAAALLDDLGGADPPDPDPPAGPTARPTVDRGRPIR